MKTLFPGNRFLKFKLQKEPLNKHFNQPPIDDNLCKKNVLSKKDEGLVFAVALILLIVISSLLGLFVSYEKTKLSLTEKKSFSFYTEIEEHNSKILKEAEHASH